MNFIEQRKKDAELIDLKETQLYIENLYRKKTGKIISKIPAIDGIEIEFRKDEKDIIFTTGKINFISNLTQYQQSGYGIVDAFKINVAEKIYEVPNGAKTISFRLKEMNLSGSITNVEHNYSTEGTYFYRALLPVDRYARTPIHYFLGRAIINGESFNAAGYIDLVINRHKIGFFDYNICNRNYLIIEVKERISYTSLKDILDSVIYSFAFISGSLFRDNITILKFEHANFKNIVGHKFEKLKDSIVSRLELYNPSEHQFHYDLSKKIYFPIEVLSNLAEQLYNSKPLSRAVRVLTQARNQPVEIETAAFFIALETVKQLVIEENSEKIQPFKNKTLAQKTVKELRSIVKCLPDDEFNDKNAVIRKIENLNSIGNSDAFKLAFQILGLGLTEDDEKCIAMRNKFLHGNVPFDNECDETRKNELSIINLNAHLLVCILILKHAGYSGPVKNYLKYLDLINNVNVIRQPLFRHI